ncbi:MAG TPA: hypothetical protein VF254_05950 [Gammaproteobacteria bacterium]
MKPFSKRFFPLVAATILSACGGGDSGGEENPPPPPPPNESPSISVIFPPHDGMLTAKETVTLRGTASDTDGHVQGVSVNGVEAESMDGYESWTVTVPLEIGDNALDVRVLDDGDGEAVRTVAVKRIKPPFPIYPTAVTVDPGTGRTFVSDSTGEQVAEINPETGEIVAMLAGPGIGSGARLRNPHEAVLDAANNRLFVVNNEIAGSTDRASIVAIDLSTQVRTEISGPDRGEGPSLLHNGDGPRALAFDRNRTLYATNLDMLYVVDIETGNRQVFDVNEYQPQALVFDVELDAGTGILYLASWLGRVLTFDTQSQTFSTVGDRSDAMGVMPYRLRDMALDSDAGRLYLASMGGFYHVEGSEGLAAIAYMELSSGQRHEVFLDSPDSSQFEFLDSIAAPLPGGRLPVVDGEAHAIMHLNVENGEAVKLSQAVYERGFGPHLALIPIFAGDPETGLFVIDSKDDLYHVDPVTGDRNFLAGLGPVEDEETGEAPEFEPQAMAYHKEANVLWIARFSEGGSPEHLYRFDVSSGLLETIAFELPAGTRLDDAASISLSSDGRYLYMKTHRNYVDPAWVSEILEVDLETRKVRVIIGGTEVAKSVGSGPSVADPWTAIRHPVDDFLYVEADAGLVRVDLKTLQREIVEWPEAFEALSNIALTHYGDHFVVRGRDIEKSIMRFAHWQPGEAPAFLEQTEDRRHPNPFNAIPTVVGADVGKAMLLLYDVNDTHVIYLMDAETGEYLLMSH